MYPAITSHPVTGEPTRPYTKRPGYEPLPGYRILEPLGQGGFGEVWLCEAPGGLQKAIKFVQPDGTGAAAFSLTQEFEAFQTIKAIRHPFLLTLERVEIVEGELVMVMELADAHLQDRFYDCRNQGLPGIPRLELLGYLHDAAEALDHINHKYGLQHLDVKPANLFLLSDHVKVGDYGLVCRLTATGQTHSLVNRGMTPRYVAPEVLRGHIHSRSDQYSLALVYYELLTGGFPYVARSAQQMMLAHVSGKPDLSLLPPGDVPVVAKALSKVADERFASCRAFIQALYAVSPPEAFDGDAAQNGVDYNLGYADTDGTSRMPRPHSDPMMNDPLAGSANSGGAPVPAPGNAAAAAPTGGPVTGAGPGSWGLPGNGPSAAGALPGIAHPLASTTGGLAPRFGPTAPGSTTIPARERESLPALRTVQRGPGARVPPGGGNGGGGIRHRARAPQRGCLHADARPLAIGRASGAVDPAAAHSRRR